MRTSWSSAVKIAEREARASLGKFVFVILAVAAGVGALTGVRGFSGAFQGMLLRDARTLMAGDLSVRLFNHPNPKQQEAFDKLTERGVERTWISETISMMSSADSPRPLMVAVKAVEPDLYPFYGQLKLAPEGGLNDVLDAESMVVSSDLLLRLNLNRGDSVMLGDEQFRIVAEVLVEPDRMTGTMNVGPRVLISRDGLERTRLIQPGSRASQRYLFRLPPERVSIAEARGILETAFQGDRIVDFRETHPTLRRGLDRATKFLSLVSLIALIVGALGVAMAMHSHLQQRLDTIAIMKCVGGSSGQIMRIYLLQTIALGLVGSLLGVLVGYGMQTLFPVLIANYFPEISGLEWQPIAALQGVLIGVLTTLLFTVPTLLSVRRVRPAVIFRRDMDGARLTMSERLRQWRGSFWPGTAILASIATLAVWLGESVQLGVWFAGGLLVSLLILSAVAAGMLRALRVFPHWLPWKLPPSLRQGVANLHRPGNHAGAVLVSLGIGVTFTLCIYLIQSSVLTQMVRSAPPNMPNVFFINVTNQERDGLLEVLRETPGIKDEPELIPSVAARLVGVDATPVEEMDLGNSGRRFRRTRTITWRSEQPESIEILEGEWWPAERAAGGRHQASASEGVAELLGIKLGAQVEWTVGGQTVLAKVVAIHRSERIRPGASIGFILTPEALEGLPTTYYGGVRVDPQQAIELQQIAFDRFPNITVINAADVLEIVQQVVDQIGLVVRFVSGFAILGGIIILASGVMATRFRRIRDVAILKTLGATRKKIANMFSAEFLILGSVAGLMGSILATGFSGLLLVRVLDAEFQFDPVANGVCVVATALLANLAGWLSSFRILSRKPLEVLRGE